MNNSEEFEFEIRPRESEIVSIKLPKDTLESLKKVADIREMSSLEALLRFYIGQGLRQDLSKIFAVREACAEHSRLLESTAEVLAQHIDSEEEVSAILREIRAKVAR